MITAIAIDDEPLALEVIKIYCDSIAEVNLVKTFTSHNKAKLFLNKFPVDVIFLDVEMPKNNGFDFYKSLNCDSKVVFTTAFDKYAVEGFNVDAVDYLLKPFSLDRFKKAVNRICNLIKSELDSVEKNTHLAIRADYKLNRIPLKQIVYLEAMNDYVKIYIKNETTIVARATMKSILHKLPADNFVRIHKSFIVSRKWVKTVSATDIHIEDEKLPIGNSYKKHLSTFFN
ncbi:LytTR family DNA-binding domain-containing protein [Cellulophaga baltica]|uniref:LytR/AlgR family response regulator transcription factor n=1 Tax=Cellulophaga TaxID=104264 RepID=UPI001C072A55|nr:MULTISPECIES: LytTR family DNA-binding domain-containing protein [Cellulophaga]MBU2995825.1 LytTR family DNA-binding domain-containing protein [Cellulophaga baltica]MDO6767220.1 LytTR family DNA-binding domain-containing protein [Cellulophaga sp. 1_MG-2023]